MPGNFLSSVHSVYLEGTILYAECTRQNREMKSACIDLNKWITNEDGQLKWKDDGNFGASCDNIRLEGDGALLICDARRRDGSIVSTSLDLNSRIANVDGEFKVE